MLALCKPPQIFQRHLILHGNLLRGVSLHTLRRMNIVLMAGGGGSRLWPLSRKDQPKQFLTLGVGATLLEQAFDRASQVTDRNNIYVATIKEYEDRVRKLLPSLLTTHILLEPERRDTGPAFAATAAHLMVAGQGNEPVIFMWSDHVFTAEEQYVADLKRLAALIAQQPSRIAIMGHIPTYAETGFGYIETGSEVEGQAQVFEVVQFKEKPDKATAEHYVTSGKYFWNMGSICTTPNHLLAELKLHAPDLAAGVEQYKDALEEEDTEAAAHVYGTLPKISIDYALLEHATEILVVTGDYGWSDIGNWSAVQDIFGTEGDHAGNGHHVHVDALRNFVYNTTNKAVSLIGLEDTIVVVTDDAVLVTKKDRAHQVKEVVAKLEEDGKSEYL